MNLKERAKALYTRFRVPNRYSGEISSHIVNADQQIDVSSAHMIRYIDNLKDLDQELIEVHEAFQISDDEGRRRLSQFQYLLPSDFPSDPYSAEYANAQMQIYLALSGRESYNPTDNEHSAFNLEQAKQSPFPYYTQSPTTVGEQLIAQGFLIRAMNLPAQASIVEFGPGWGNTTLHLAQMGYRVTAVEIEKDFVELIHHRAQLLSLDITLANQDMASFQSTEQYDAALFFESFHHCADHLQLLHNLDVLIKPDGLIAFASEPIIGFSHPWGFVRTDGLTLWSIRKFGWFELGFDTSYFLRTLLLFGWLPKQSSDDVTPITNIIIARKSKGLYSPSELTLPPDEAISWFAPEIDYRYTTARSIMSCAKFWPVKIVEFCLSNFASLDLEVTLQAGSTKERINLPARSDKVLIRIDVDHWQGQVIISSQTWRPADSSETADQRELGVAVHWLQLLTK